MDIPDFSSAEWHFPRPPILSARDDSATAPWSKFDARSRDQTGWGEPAKSDIRKFPRKNARTLVEGHVERAVEHFEQAVSGVPQIGLELAQIYAATGRRQEALRAAGEASQYFPPQATAEPDQPLHRMRWGRSELFRGNFEEAAKILAEGLNFRTRNRSIGHWPPLLSRGSPPWSPVTRTTCPHNFNSWIAC